MYIRRASRNCSQHCGSSGPRHCSSSWRQCLPERSNLNAWRREPETYRVPEAPDTTFWSESNAVLSGLSEPVSSLCRHGQQYLMWSSLTYLPNNGHFSNTTRLFFFSAFSAFFSGGLTTHADVGRWCGLIRMTDLKYFHLFLGNLGSDDSCLFADFSYFNTWSFPEGLFWRYWSVQLQFQILFSLPDGKLRITFKSFPLPLLLWPDHASVCPDHAPRVCCFFVSWVACLCLCILLPSYKTFDSGLLSLEGFY